MTDRSERALRTATPGVERRRLRARALRVLGVCLGVVAVACASRDVGPAYAGYNQERAERLFAVGYQDIADIYIEDVTLETLALGGLKRLPGIDGGLHVRHENASVVLSYNNRRRSFPLPTRADPDAWADLTVDVLDTARRYSKAVESTPAPAIYRTMFAGIVAHLDRYSRYAGAEQAADNRAHRDGFGGIGVHIRVRPKGIEVVSVLDNTPAADAGLEPGDLITAVNGRPAAELRHNGGAEALRGPVDTDVRLTVEPANSDSTRQIAVHRTHIVPRTVSYERRGNAAYLRVSGFNQRTARALREAVTRAKAELGDRLAGYVLDLRGNPGGLLDQAVTVADVFLPSGQVVSTHGRHPDSHQYFDAEAGDPGEDAPLVVLINADSASASEIVAAALQDSGRGLVLGSTSYGKGTVQTVLRLPNEGELTLTWARFMAPSGYALSKHGVVPNVCTSLGETRDVRALLRELRRGRLAPGVQSHPTAAGVDNKADMGRSEALAACPADGTERESDVALARRLLQDRNLFEAAMAGKPARIAKADAAPAQP